MSKSDLEKQVLEDEKIKCLRCDGHMVRFGTEHRIFSRHFGQILIDLWGCLKCPYLEYRRRKVDPNKMENLI